MVSISKFTYISGNSYSAEEYHNARHATSITPNEIRIYYNYKPNTITKQSYNYRFIVNSL
jgi:hypothetical protein